ncbi:hypothetical protein AOLI_G00185570 [Acnodon oligacanthus]
MNDNYPEITIKSLKNTVKEDIPVGTVIALVGVSDRDTGDNGKVNLTINKNLPFILNKSSDYHYELLVSEPLDREMISEYEITLVVTDGGTPPLSDNETIIVHLLDVNDNAPQFPQSFYTISVMENNSPGALLSSITALDPDLHENQYLVYFIIEKEIANTSMSMLFSINPENGNLYALKTFDYEIEKEFLFHIEARDSGVPPLSSNVTVHIIVMDQNDNAPVIVSPWRAHGSVVEEKIPRSTDKGTLIAKVIAIDTDSVHNSRITYQFLQNTDATLFSLDQYNGEIRTMRMFSYRDSRHQRLVVIAKDNGEPSLSATVTIKLSTVETALKTYADLTEVPLEYDIFSDLNLYLVIGLGSVSFLLLITILVTIVLKCQKPKPSKAAPPCRNSVISERNSTIADSTLVSNDAYWYSLFLAETRKGKLVVRQPVPKGARYIVSSIPRSTGLTETSDSAASTLQFLQNTDATLFSLDQYNGEIRTMRMFSYRDSRHQRLVVIAKDNGEPSLSATVTIKLSTVETALKTYADLTEVPLEYDIFSDLNLYLVIGLGSVSFLLLITILVTIVLKCQKPKPSKAAPPCRNSVISERNSTIADSTLVSNDAYWYSLFLAETRKGKLVVRQPVPKGARYIVSSIPRSTGLTETSDSAASTLQTGRDGSKFTDLILKKALDREEQAVHNLILTAVDGGVPARSGTASIIVRVLDTNDNSPQFEKEKSSDNYYELVVSEPLDREKVPEYDITFTVTDRGNPPLSDNETMTLELLDVNDNVPQFPQSFYTIQVVENNAPGALLSSLTAHDPDLHENQYLVYFIIEKEIANTSMSMLFSINPENGNLYALKTFDYEIEKEFLFHIEARDSGVPPLSSNVTVHVIIMDQNDNTPVIVSPWRAHGSVVEEKIPRSTDKGTLIAKVIAIDTDSVHNSRITYQFLQNTDATLFSLDQYNGEIRTMRMFSYRDSRHQRLVVIAKDNGEPSLSATVTIKLSTVETALKTYADLTEVPLEYDIFSDLNLYLVIGLGSVSFLLLITILVTIVLKCQKPKPSKAAPPCRNSVISERNSTIADSTLVSNDAYWYSLFLAETRKGKLVVRQPVPKGARYIVSSIPRSTGLTETSDSAASTLQTGRDGSKFTDLILKKALDREEQAVHNLILTAVDGGVPARSGTASIIVRVLDTNDNSPQFEKEKSSDNYYELVVSEPLDREKVPEYDITFTVTDRGNPPLSDNETMTLELLDVNDNVPQFPQSFYTIQVVENNAPGALLSSLTAHDPDLHENQYLVYFIIEKEIANTSMSMLFSINPENGNLYALKTFDYEIEKEFLFHMEARDSGVPPLSSNVTVHIIVMDQNDNAPVIVSPWRAHGSVVEEKIPRSTDKGTLIAKVIAIDTDSVHNSRITYQFLQNTDATLFSLDQYNGEIRTMRMFSYRDSRHQRLVVIAKDNGEPSLSATVTIKLSTVETALKTYADLTEVPLEYDIFSDLNLYLVIGLGSVSFLLLITILVTIVLKCQKPKPSKAAPPCRNSVISERNSTIADSTLVSNDAYWYSLFLAETRKGKLVVRQPVPKGARYIVSSIPRSTGLTETSDSAASTLQFRRDTIHLDISESTPAGERFSLSNAVDPDIGSNSIKTYYLSESEHFDIEIQTGRDGSKFADLILKRVLDRETQAIHNLILTAVDGGVPARSGTASIIVRVLDTNDNAPKFDKDSYKINLMENSPIGSLVVKLNATDLDEESSDNYYELVVSEPLDREKVPEYDITFTVTDRGNPPLSDNETMTLELLDVNDNVPQFPQSFYTIQVVENNAPGALLSSLTAHDPDLHENQYLVYFIIEKEIANTSMSMLFSINPENGNLYALKTFDYEIEKEFLFHIEARDSGVPPLSSNVTVHIIIMDQNDNTPVIVSPWRAHGSVVEEKIPRSTDKGTLIAKVIAIDTDSVHNSRITYQFLQNTDATLFSLDQYNGEIRTMRMFSYRDSRHQRLVVIAKDNGEPSLSATVTIKLSTVETALKTYADLTEVPLEYDIFSDLNLYLVIGLGSVSFLLLITILVTIVLKCQKPKPSKAAPPCRNSVISERNSTIADSTLVSNDAYWYSLFLAETRKGKLVVRQPVPKGARYIVSSIPRSTGLTETSDSAASTLQFLQNTDATLFSLDQYNGEIRTMRMFSYRDSRHQRLVVIAKDNGEPSLSATVTIKLSTVETALKTYADLTEVPLEYDIFSDLNLYLVIGLGSVSFLLLITILVTIVLKCQKPKPSKAAPPCRNSVISERNSTIADSTLVSNDAYWYSLFLAETRKGKLVVRQPVPKGARYIVSSIPRSTGLTETKSSDNYYELVVSEPLDREKVPEYDITFTVTDRGNPPLSDNETMTLELLDVNDNVPQFPQSFYTIQVVENNAPGALLSSLTAHDPDLHENQYLVYFIIEKEIANTSMSMLFSINPENGNLYALKTFDYEIEKEFLFHIEARDSGVPPLSSNVTVHIIVMDQNDNTPVIVSPWRAHGSVVEEKIPRSTDKGTLIAKVIAIDTDSVHNSRITYQFLQNTDATLFSLDQYNGEIRTMRMFSYRDSRHQRLVVIAKDNGEPSLSATVTIKLSTVETALKTYADLTEVPLEYDIFSDLNLYLVIGLGSVSFLLLITILVTIVLKCQKPKPSKAAPPCRNSVISERNSTIADSTLVSNDAYWYSLFLAETRKGKLVVRQPVPKGARYIVSSIPRSTGLTETSDSAASTLQTRRPNLVRKESLFTMKTGFTMSE